MSNTKTPLEGITIEDFHRLVEDPLVTLGRAFAPVINAALMRVKQCGNQWKVVRPDGRVAGLFPTNAEAWRWVDRNTDEGGPTR